jgi:hypothetical protein
MPSLIRRVSINMSITFSVPGAKTSGVSHIMNFVCIYVKHGDTLTYPVSQDKLDEVTSRECSGIGSYRPRNFEYIAVHGDSS